MKITEIIEDLSKAKEKYGDVEVVAYNEAGFVRGACKLSVSAAGAPFDRN